MNYVRLGHAGLKVSRLGLGAMGFDDRSWRSWVLDLEKSRAVFRRAVDAEELRRLDELYVPRR